MSNFPDTRLGGLSHALDILSAAAVPYGTSTKMVRDILNDAIAREAHARAKVLEDGVETPAPSPKPIYTLGWDTVRTLRETKYLETRYVSFLAASDLVEVSPAEVFGLDTAEVRSKTLAEVVDLLRKQVEEVRLARDSYRDRLREANEARPLSTLSYDELKGRAYLADVVDRLDHELNTLSNAAVSVTSLASDESPPPSPRPSSESGLGSEPADRPAVQLDYLTGKILLDSPPPDVSVTVSWGDGYRVLAYDMNSANEVARGVEALSQQPALLKNLEHWRQEAGKLHWNKPKEINTPRNVETAMKSIWGERDLSSPGATFRFHGDATFWRTLVSDMLRAIDQENERG